MSDRFLKGSTLKVTISTKENMTRTLDIPHEYKTILETNLSYKSTRPSFYKDVSVLKVWGEKKDCDPLSINKIGTNSIGVIAKL